jgi:hypothetical protein
MILAVSTERRIPSGRSSLGWRRLMAPGQHRPATAECAHFARRLRRRTGFYSRAPDDQGVAGAVQARRPARAAPGRARVSEDWRSRHGTSSPARGVNHDECRLGRGGAYARRGPCASHGRARSRRPKRVPESGRRATSRAFGVPGSASEAGRRGQGETALARAREREQARCAIRRCGVYRRLSGGA